MLTKNNTVSKDSISFDKLIDNNRLTAVQNESKPLTFNDNRSVLFKLAIVEVLDSAFSFKKLKTQDIKQFSQFVSKTVGKKLTISTVEKLFLRTGGPNGPKSSENFHGVKRDMFHFSNGTRDFRIHGYYQLDYFVITRIDPHHKYKF